MRNPPLHDRRRQDPRLRPARGHPLGRPGLGDRGGGTARARSRLPPRRAGPRHLLRHADDVRRIGRARRVERASGVRPRLYRHPRRLPAVRGAVAKGRARRGVDEPRRQGRCVAGRIPCGRRQRRRPLCRDRRRRAAVLRRALSPGGGAYAAGRRAPRQFHPPGRGLPQRLDDGPLPRAGDRQDPPRGRPWRCRLRPFGRRRFGGRRSPAARGDRRPADLHLCRYRPVACRRGGGGGGPLPPPLQHPADRPRRWRIVSRQARRGHRSGAKAQGNRRRFYRRVRRGGVKAGRHRFSRPRDALPRRYRVRRALSAAPRSRSNRTTMSAACRSG